MVPLSSCHLNYTKRTIYEGVNGNHGTLGGWWWGNGLGPIQFYLLIICSNLNSSLKISFFGHIHFISQTFLQKISYPIVAHKYQNYICKAYITEKIQNLSLQWLRSLQCYISGVLIILLKFHKSKFLKSQLYDLINLCF